MRPPSVPETKRRDTLHSQFRKENFAMKKFLTILLCAAMVVSVMGMTVSAKNFVNEKALVFQPEAFNGVDEDPYLTVNAEDDAVAQWLSFGYGWFTMIDDYPTFMTSPLGNLWTVSIPNSQDVNLGWQVYPERHPFMKLRYCMRFYTEDITVLCDVCDGQGFLFTLTADGEWHDLILDLYAQEGLDWDAYVEFWNSPENNAGLT